MSGFVFADGNLPEDIEVVKQDIVKTGFDVWVLVKDTGTCLYNNVPSPATLIVDGSFDGLIRQWEPIANGIRKLEEVNPINGAIVRDGSKALTIAFKMHLKLPVDLSGRLYDRADLYAQIVKLVSKGTGFLSLYGLSWIGSPVACFIVNNGGDVLSQAVLDAGKTWRRGNKTASFEEFAVQNYSIENSIFSIPAKGTVSFVMASLIKKCSIAEGFELLTLVVLNQAIIKRNQDATTITFANKHRFMTGFLVATVVSIVKSLILTTTSKSAADGVYYYIGDLGFSPSDWIRWPWGESATKSDEL